MPDRNELTAALQAELHLWLQAHGESIVAAALDRVADAATTAADHDSLTEEQRREDAIARLRSQGFRGRSFEALARASFIAEVDTLYLTAEGVTCGHLLNLAARARGVDPKSLFVGPQPRALKWASPELLAFWEKNGRLTFEEHCADLLGYGKKARDVRTLRAVTA